MQCFVPDVLQLFLGTDRVTDRSPQRTFICQTVRVPSSSDVVYASVCLAGYAQILLLVLNLNKQETPQGKFSVIDGPN